MRKERIELILAMVIFGTIGIFRRYIPYSSSMIAFARGVIGVLFLGGICILTRRRFDREALRKNGWLLALTGMLIGFNWILLFEAYRFTTVSVATVCYYMAPVFVMIASPFVLHEKMTIKKCLCTFAAVMGIILTSGVLTDGLQGMTGVCLGLGAALLYATVILLNKRIREMPTFERTVIQLLMAAISVFPYVCLTEDFQALQFDPLIIAMLIVVGIVHTGFAYLLYFDSIDKNPVQLVAVFSYLDPIIAVILSVMILHETMTMSILTGTILVLGAAFLSENN